MRNDHVGGVALIGQPGSGKTSIAAELDKLLGWPQLSFAGLLRSDVASMLAYQEHPLIASSLSRMAAFIDHAGAMVLPNTKDKYRPLLQAYGSYKRAEDENYWLDRTLKAMNEGERYVIDDCRYMNEYEALRARGFVFVYLMPGLTTRRLDGQQAAHESEQDWRKFMINIDLTYEPGPRHQAERIVAMLKNEHPSLRDEADGMAPMFFADAPCDCDGDNGDDCCRNFDDDGVLSEHTTQVPGHIERITFTFDPPYCGHIEAEYVVQDEEAVTWGPA